MKMLNYFFKAATLSILVIFCTLINPNEATAQEPFIGEIRMFAGNFAPRGWAFCDGQILAIGQNEALFSLLGTIYGGDGRSTFALPDLRGRVPVGPRQGPGLSNYNIGQRGGRETNTLTISQLPSHSHQAQMNAYDNGAIVDKADNALLSNGEIYSPSQPNPTVVNMHPTTISVLNTGGNQPIENRQPYVAINYIIALQGLYPPRN